MRGLELGRGVMAEDEGVTSVDTNEARDRSDQRRLSRAVRSKQAKERTGRDPQAQRVQSKRPVAVDLRQPLDEERGVGAVEVDGHSQTLRAVVVGIAGSTAIEPSAAVKVTA